SDSEDNVQVQIRERDKDQEDYIKPALLVEYEKEVEEENRRLAEEEGDDETEESDEESVDESDEEEDEDAALLTPAIDTQILRTIAAIQTKDPSVYDTNKKFFTSEQFDASKKQWQQKSKTKDKKVTLKDYERELLLEHGGYVDEEQENNKDRSNDLTHVEEQAQLKKAFQLAAQQNDSDNDNDQRQDDKEDSDDDDGFLVKREKSKSEKEAEEDDYRQFLLNNLKEDEASSKAFADWENFKENPNVNADDAFLIDYVLNRGWVDKKGKQNPTYNEIVDVDKDVDEQYLDDVDRFESKYNFRYEEAEGSRIVTHARDIGDSVRRKTNKRKERRERLKAAKQLLKEQKTEELKRLKNEKRKEIHNRLAEIQKITGTGISGLEHINFEEDFDPEKYDEQMAKIFDDGYYDANDTEKPVFEDDDDDDFNYDDDEQYGEDDLMMDADYLPGGEKYEETKKNKKGKKRALENDQQEKPKPKDAEYNKLVDDYYALDFEDVIGGDLPTRFKYTKTEPEDFGLTPVEILLADDKELNKYLSIRTIAP
ncbi:KRI1-like family C-terminal-domain-containing protein, partial [Halteromyces radiatus]|uniref:KRI1-like family C-terminal-domain-containing protein n=1 Tax=Halteromyces radiatus TaxID=101107 RepID=UPI00221E5E58